MTVKVKTEQYKNKRIILSVNRQGWYTTNKTGMNKYGYISDALIDAKKAINKQSYKDL